MGRNHWGETSPTSKLKEWQVQEILDLLQDCSLSYREIAQRYGVHVTAVQNIKENRTWKHVKRRKLPGCRFVRSAGSRHKNSKLTESDVRRILRRIENGESNVSIAEDFPVNHSEIHNIRHGKSWKHVA